MMKVLQPFYDGVTFKTYTAGMEIADDPALAWAEARGLVKTIKPEAKVAEKKEEKPAPAKKATAKKATKK